MNGSGYSVQPAHRWMVRDTVVKRVFVLARSTREHLDFLRRCRRPSACRADDIFRRWG